MYYATVAAAALHQVLFRTMTKALRDDNVVAQNVASGLFCVLFVALGVCNRPTLLAATMLGYLISDSTSVTTAGYAVHHFVTAMLLLVSLRGNGAYDDLTIVLGCASKFHGVFVLNRRVDLHAIDATPARWRVDFHTGPRWLRRGLDGPPVRRGHFQTATAPPKGVPAREPGRALRFRFCVFCVARGLLVLGNYSL